MSSPETDLAGAAPARRAAAAAEPAATPFIVRPWARPLAWLVLQSLLLMLALGSLLWNVVAWGLLPLLRRERALRVGRAGIARGYAFFWWACRRSGLLRMDARALDPLAAEPGLVVVANHPSMLDAVMLVARLPRSTCVMKASLARNPFLSAAARLAGYIRNDSAYWLVRHAVADLRAGGQLVLFPEGTRTTQWPVNPFHSTVGIIAHRAQVPVQTVFIDTDSPYLGKGWPIWRLPPLPIVFTVRLGQRFQAGPSAHAFQSELEAYFAAGVQRQAPPP